MATMTIKVGNTEELVAFTDGPGYLTMDQGDHEISINLIQAIALAEFIIAHRAEMTEAYKRHLRGK